MNNKDCNIDDCPFTVQDGDKTQEETEIKTVDLCNDPVCSNVVGKKIVDMTQGIFQLENILRAMTGLCREPKCPTKSPSFTKKVTEHMPTFPEPTRYLPTTDIMPEKEELCKIDDPECKRKAERDTYDFPKICKGTVCYNAYMGYKMEPLEKDPKFCESNTCLPKFKTPKSICISPNCPFYKKDTNLTNAYGSNLFSEKPKTTMGPCGGFSCPPPKTDYSSSYKTNIYTDLKPTNLPSTSSPLNKPCTMTTCPLSQQETQAAVGLCGRTSCPFASVEYAQQLDLKTPNYGGDAKFNSSDRCNDPNCQFHQTTAPCGNTSCQYGTIPSGPPPPVGLCGRTSCPFAAIKPSVKPRTTAPCGNVDCSFGEVIYDPVGLCGQTECPMMSKTSPGAVQPCPFATSIKRYPCGSPSCPYINPSGMLHTHEYTNDKSYVQEAARPYCGSASPFDYLSSITPSYPSPYATNYPLFNYTEPPVIPPCPYLPKKKKKTCGIPTCPYAEGNKKEEKPEKDNFCIDQTCPYGEGICGGPRKYSCESKNVEPCESPDCPVKPKKKKKEKCCTCGGTKTVDDDDFYDSKPKKDKTCCCRGFKADDDPSQTGVCAALNKKKKHRKRSMRDENEEIGICGGPKKYSCDQPNVEFCGGPECKVGKREENEEIGICEGPKKYSCDQPNVEICSGPGCKVPKREEIEEIGICGGPKKYSCDQPNVEFCGGPECKVTKKPDDCGRPECHVPIKKTDYDDETFVENIDDTEKCSAKTCPYLKKLVFCDDCGGVLPDEAASSSSENDTNTFVQTAEGTVGSYLGEGESTIRKLSSKKGFEQQFVIEEHKITVPPPASLYDYPGVQIGHKECDFRRRRIPKNMGWLWNCVPTFGNPEFWRGYKPGAVLKSVYKIIKNNRKQVVETTEAKKKKRGRKGMIDDLKHCIEVKKKEGEYSIIVNPVKDPKTRDPFDTPYMDCTPIQFKIEKEKIEKPEKDPNYCPCDDEVSEQPSVHSSEFEFHFTPAAAIPETYVKKKKNMAERDVQYDIMDLPPELRANIKSLSKGKGKGKKGKGKKGKK